MRFLPVLLSVLLFAPPVAGQDIRAVTGALTYPARIALSSEAELLIELRDGAGALVAEQRAVTEGAQVPIPFALEAPAGVALTVRGALREDGKIRWLGAPLGIEPGSGPVDLGAVALQPFTPMGFGSTFDCGEVTADIAFAGEAARLRVGAEYRDLSQVETASGAKYVSDADPGTWIWTKGDVATLSLRGRELPECREALPEESYAARGNEPGWRVEITGGRMTYLGDYGETEIEAPLPVPQIVDGAHLYAPEGTELALSLRLALCHDDMSGMPYPDTARVETGGKVFNGCGGAPVDLLAGHPWRVEDIGGGGIIDASYVTLDFARSGTVSGRGGCNRYTARFELTGEGLSVGQAAATLMACPEALMDQERRFFQALDAVERFDVTSDGALVLSGGGAPLLVARR